MSTCPPLLFLYYSEGDDNERLNCKVLADKLVAVKDLPRECLAYNDVINSILRRNTKTGNAFEGMQAGSAQSAKAARVKGKESYAQIQRRYTNSRRFTKKD